ncbi:Uncharacterized protein DAT39_013207, partial [Clarias magur]
MSQSTTLGLGHLSNPTQSLSHTQWSLQPFQLTSLKMTSSPRHMTSVREFSNAVACLQ